jgi:hypothetical protein
MQITCNWAPGWEMVSALATVALTIAIFVAIRRFRFDAWLRAEELIRSFHQDRAKVFLRLPFCSDKWEDDEEKKNALDVCRKMNTVAYFLRFLPQREVLEHWDDPFAKAWAVCEKIVNEERDKTRWKIKWRHFEKLGQLALEKLVREGRDPREQKENQIR